MANQEKSLYKRIKSRFAEMQDVRRPFEEPWKELIGLLRPDLSAWEDETIDSQGKKRNVDVYAGAPQHALSVWTDGLLGHTASPSLDWFHYRLPGKKANDIAAIRKWLQNSEEAVASLLKDSNYYSHLSPYYRDGGSIGDAASWIEKNKKEDGIACANFHPREIFVDEDSQERVDTFYRYYEMTAKNAADAFGKEKLSLALNNALDKNPLARFKFIHASHNQNDPILKDIEGEKIPDRPWISIYLQEATDGVKENPLRIAGYWSSPFSYWRMFKTSGSVYGLGLGSFALVDIFGLNQIARTMLRAANMAVDPPIYAHREMRGKVHIKPHGLTFGDRPEHRPEVVYDGGKYPFGVDREERMTAAMNRWFDVDFFLMLSQTDKVFTATQVLQMANERAILLAPKIGRLNRDKYDQDHDRILDLAAEMGKIDPPPDILLEHIARYGDRIDVQYNGLLEQAQRKQREIGRTELVFTQLAPVLSIAPEEKDWLKLGKTVVRIAREGGLPEDEVATEDEVAAIRQARAEALAAQAKMEMMERAAKAIPSLQRETAPTSPLAALTGAGT